MAKHRPPVVYREFETSATAVWPSAWFIEHGENGERTPALLPFDSPVGVIGEIAGQQTIQEPGSTAPLETPASTTVGGVK